MKNKIGRIGRLMFGTVFILAFFSCIRIIMIYYYHLQAAKGSQTLAMTLIDKVSAYDIPSLITGGLWGCVFTIMVGIILNK